MINFCILIRSFAFNSYSKSHPIHAGDRLEIRKVLFNLLICLLHKYAGMSKNEEDILCPAGEENICSLLFICFPSPRLLSSASSNSFASGSTPAKAR